MKYRLIIDKNAEEEITAIVNAPSLLTQQIENLVLAYSGADGIVGYSNDVMRKMTFDEIECITVIDRKVIAVDTKGEHYYVRERLRNLESVLPSYFIRINKSTLANEHCICQFDAVFSGGIDAVFKCGYREYVSRRCFSQIRKRYERI